MEKNIYFYQGRDKFDELSDQLAKLVEDLHDLQKKKTKNKKEKILLDLESMSHLAKSLNGITEKNFDLLKHKITLYLDKDQDFDNVIAKCVELQNQLWEL